MWFVNGEYITIIYRTAEDKVHPSSYSISMNPSVILHYTLYKRKRRMSKLLHNKH